VIQYQNAGEIVMSEDLIFLSSADIYWVGMPEPVYPSASEVTTLWHYTNAFIIIITTKNHQMCENYIANYEIFQKHQLNSSRISSISRSNFKFQEISKISTSCKHLEPLTAIVQVNPEDSVAAKFYSDSTEMAKVTQSRTLVSRFKIELPLRLHPFNCLFLRTNC